MKKMKKMLVALLVVFMTLQGTLPSFASEVKSIPNESQVLKIHLDESIEYNNIKDVLVNPKFKENYGYLKENDVVKYKENSKENLSIDIEGYVITYYQGDNYVVVDEEAGLSLITFENGNAYINGVYYEIQEEDDPFTTLSSTLIRSHTHTFNVASLTIGVIGGLVVLACPTLLIKSVVTSALADTFASFLIPDEMQPVVQYKHRDYMEVIDPFIGIYEWTYYSTLYYGTAAKPTKHFVGSWTKTQTKLM